ncbi:hypothetical protein NKI48_03155 [Mesorhizobium sp. M0644]|uniref:hypothetical protein n=1 Tax=Mesorhizobium sp. M0644 TaxID=2956979 RepID=UPI003335D8FD
MTISKETATEIAYAYREIETAEKLLAEIVDALGKSIVAVAPDIRDAFGRRQDGLQLGVPSGDTGHRLFNVPWALARPIIEAHISAKKALISALNEKARIELDAGASAP